MGRIRNGLIMALAVMGTGLLVSCGGGGGAAATTTTTTTTTATVGSSASSSGSTAVYSNNGATYAVTPTAAASVTAGSSQASLVSLPNTGTAVGALSVASISATKITTTLKTASGSAAPVNGTSVDPVNGVGLAYSYTSKSISFFDLTTKLEVKNYDTLTATTGGWSGGSALIPGVVMDGTRKYAIAATGDGFEIIDYATPAASVKVREIKSVAIAGGANKGGVEVNENFGYEPAITLGGTSRSLILTGGNYYSNSNGNALELVDVATGYIYIPDTATKALFTTSSYIDHIAVDTTYHVAVLADEGAGTTFVDLSKLTLGTTLNANGYYSYTLPTTAVSRITTFTKYTNLAIESTNHLVFMGKGYGGTTFVVGKLANPATTLGFSSVTTTPVSMPSAADNNNATVTWSGSGDPHGAGAYLTPTGHPTYTTQTSLALWASNDGSHIAIIDMQGVLDGQSVTGYNPTTTNPKDIAYFAIP